MVTKNDHYLGWCSRCGRDMLIPNGSDYCDECREELRKKEMSITGMKCKVYFGKMVYGVIGDNVEPITEKETIVTAETGEAVDYLPPQNLKEIDCNFAIEINGTIYGVAGMEIVNHELWISAF